MYSIADLRQQRHLGRGACAMCTHKSYGSSVLRTASHINARLRLGSVAGPEASPQFRV